MKQHLPLAFATAIIVVNLFFAAHFVSFIHRAEAFQAGKTIHLPTPRTVVAVVDDTLRLSMRADGTVYVGDTIMTDATLRAVLKSNSQRRIILEADRHATYPDIRALLSKLQHYGIRNITLSIKN